MAVIYLSGALKLGASCGWGQRRYDVMMASDSNGAQQARLLGPPRWTLQLVQPQMLSPSEAGAWLAMIAQLRGRVNVLAAWDPMRPVPQGTMRGTLTLAAAATSGATSISVTGGVGQAGKTLRAGDMLQLGTGLGTSQLVMVTADATADGSGVVALSIQPPLRIGFGSGAAVEWNQPTTFFRLQSEAVAWTYAPGGLVTGIALDLLETWV